jgi:acyl-CoA dehydrogenase
LPPLAKYLLTYLFVQAEFSLMCPVSMTDSLTRTLRKFASPDLLARYLPALTETDLDALHQGAMFITEQEAGSDVAAVTVRAEPVADGRYALWGEKWFCSNPDADLALVLARPAGAPPGLTGLGLFLLPRLLPEGGRNAYRIVRLKEKLGSRALPTGEIRLEGALAWRIGEVGRGFHQMADMINSSRLSNGVRAAGLMRRAMTEALFYASRRQAFGTPIKDLPLMRRTLYKMLVPTEQARSMMFEAALALARADAGEAEAASLLRILTPLYKFRACRDARRVTGEAMEVRGGLGYIEEWPEPRLLRDAHLGSIWEGTSNVVALDVIRAGRRQGSFEALRRHLEGARGEGLAALGAAPLLERVFALAERAGQAPACARQAASALYHLTTAVAMAWEAVQLADTARLELARLVLTHRLEARDPLAPDEDPPPAPLARALAAITAAWPGQEDREKP